MEARDGLQIAEVGTCLDMWLGVVGAHTKDSTTMVGNCGETYPTCRLRRCFCQDLPRGVKITGLSRGSPMSRPRANPEGCSTVLFSVPPPTPFIDPNPLPLCRAPSNGWVCGPGVIRQFAPPITPIEGRVSLVWVFLATLGTSGGWTPEAVMGLDSKCTKDAMKGREGPTTRFICCKQGRLSREGPKTKSGCLEHFLEKGLSVGFVVFTHAPRRPRPFP